LTQVCEAHSAGSTSAGERLRQRQLEKERAGLQSRLEEQNLSNMLAAEYLESEGLEAEVWTSMKSSWTP